jgi:membrane associated rhomboid family serine protease
MGIYDRDYYQEEERTRWGSQGFGGGRSVVVNLILINVGVYIANFLFDNRINNALELPADFLRAPWQFWRVLTYGFLHSQQDVAHILFNMIGLWVFGRDLETVYGKAELLRIYLVSIVVAGLAWAASVLFTASGPLVGASGGVMCLLILFVLHFPHRTLLFMGLVPVPAWALGAVYVLIDVLGITNDDLVAHVAHLGGAAFGFVYFRSGLNIGRLVPQRLSMSALRLRPRLKIHNPDEEERKLSQHVDRILEKISREGEASLSKGERRTLEEASRRYQRRRQ